MEEKNFHAGRMKRRYSCGVKKPALRVMFVWSTPCLMFRIRSPGAEYKRRTFRQAYLVGYREGRSLLNDDCRLIRYGCRTLMTENIDTKTLLFHTKNTSIPLFT